MGSEACSVKRQRLTRLFVTHLPDPGARPVIAALQKDTALWDTAAEVNAAAATAIGRA